jgi:hypothetical protein
MIPTNKFAVGALSALGNTAVSGLLSLVTLAFLHRLF